MLDDDVLVAPSVLSANFTRLGEELDAVANANLLHYDVMDGHFVPNLSFGLSILRQISFMLYFLTFFLISSRVPTIGTP